ncbi:DegT/DnrJ/EryC1/StrS aminotransferase family protein [bacterium]|nr:DegT/DnrJ/EryC1/StrS aminotransferase family protein [bacterium]
MMIQVLKPYYRTEEILELIRECCDTSWTGIGGKMLDFEEAWKDYSGAKTCHMLNSATSGLQLAVKQLKDKYNWEDGDKILTTSLTFVSTNHAILYNNLVPVFADIDHYGCLSLQGIKEALKDNPEIKAVVFVGLGGNVGHLELIKKELKGTDVKIILDAAHMAGTKWKKTNKQVGCDEEGIDVTIFSGQAVKNLPTSDSGWICWNGDDAEEMDKMTRELSWLGINKDTFARSSSQGSYKWYYDVPNLGFKFHANAISGCFGLVGLKYLDKDNAYRRNLSDLYSEKLDHPKIKIVPHNPECVSSRHLFQILVDKRDEIMLALSQHGIYCGVHYRDNTTYSMYSQSKDKLSSALGFSDNTISLPLHLHLTEKEVSFICEKLIEIVNK